MRNRTTILALVWIAFLAGCADPGNRTDSSEPPAPERFTKVVFDAGLYEPMELDLLDDGRILFVERRGAVKIYDPQTAQTETIAEMDLFIEFEEGLLGVASILTTQTIIGSILPIPLRRRPLYGWPVSSSKAPISTWNPSVSCWKFPFSASSVVT